MNYGWALTPDANTTADSTDILVPTNGSTTVVFIDGVTVIYNQCRGTVGDLVPAGVFCNDDIANIFGNPTPQPATGQFTWAPGSGYLGTYRHRVHARDLADRC